MGDSPITDKLSEDGENDKLRYGSSSMQGWRDTMEDAHVAILDVDNKTSFFGVYDGHGGDVVAKFCAKYLHQQVLSNEAYEAGDIETSLRRAFLRMDDMIQDPHSDFEGPTSAGSTACVALIKDKKLFVANAGDSRCVISRKGRAHNLSKDHKPELVAEEKRIREAGGYIHGERINGCLNLSRAIGDMEYKQNKSLPSEKQMVTADPDITTTELCDDDDFLVVACDGIWECMSSQGVVDFIHQQLKSETILSRVCEKVADRCVAPKNWGENYYDYDDDEPYKCVPGFDNMTIVLVQFKKPNSSEN